MNRGLAAVLMVLAVAVSSPAWTGTAIVPTTTLKAETGNNTSAADTFTAASDGNAGAGNVSKVDTHSLLYPGNATNIFAHVMPWWGKSSHINIGYNSQDPAEAQKQVSDIASRGMNGAVLDWYGPDSFEDAAIKVFANQVLAQPNFTFAVEIEHGAVLWDSCYPTCSATTAFINLANTVAQRFYSSPAYLRMGGRPVLMEFDMAAFTVDWNQVQASIAGNPLIIHYNPPGFTTASTAGAFGWLDPKTLDVEPAGYDGSAFLTYFYKLAGSYPAQHAFGSSYKGFNDILASWAPTGGRHIEQNCGQTWLGTFAIANQFYSPSHPLESLQVVTWNDYEEGSEVETGIDNCVSVTAGVSGTQLQWQITGDERTIDHYTVFISSDGQNLMPLGDVGAGIHAFDLSAYSFDPGSYALYVKAVGKPSLRNQMSAAAAYTIAAPIAPDMSLSTTPGMVTLTRGQSGQLQVAVLPSGGFSGQVALSCGGLPAGVSCSFSPAILSAGGTAGTTTLTISAPQVASAQPRTTPWMVFASFLPGVFGLVVVPASRRRKRQLALLLIVLALVTMVACAGGQAGSATTSATGTGSGMRAGVAPAQTGTYTFTINATAGALSRSTTAKLVIQ